MARRWSRLTTHSLLAVVLTVAVGCLPADSADLVIVRNESDRTLVALVDRQELTRSGERLMAPGGDAGIVMSADTWPHVVEARDAAGTLLFRRVILAAEAEDGEVTVTISASDVELAR